jgi:hypothetical protein
MKRVFFSLFVLLLSMQGFAQEGDSPKPNIILFYVDDMGWQDSSEPFHTEDAVEQ